MKNLFGIWGPKTGLGTPSLKLW